MVFLQLSDTTRAREINAELKKNKWRNEWLNPTRAWVAPGPLLDIFLFFSKTKNFHSHPCCGVLCDCSVSLWCAGCCGVSLWCAGCCGVSLWCAV